MTANAEVRKALALGTQAVQEVRACAAQEMRRAVHAAVQQERASCAEKQRERERQIVERLNEVAEREKRISVEQAIKETEERLRHSTGGWMTWSLPRWYGASSSGDPSHERMLRMADSLNLQLVRKELHAMEQELSSMRNEFARARALAVQEAVEATLLECEKATVELVQKTRREAQAECEQVKEKC
ncbi:MAG: hypothetical protein SGPRY_004669 [Prymnesium sp.]